VTGGDWIHPASNISEIYSGNVQQALVDLYNLLITLGNVVTLGTPWSIDTNPGSIPMFTTTNDIEFTTTNDIEPSPLKISYDGGYSGLIFDASAAYPLISQDSANYPGGAPYFLIQAQSNLDSVFSGTGGELWLASGTNISTSANWGTLRLISGDAPIDLTSPILQFNSSVIDPVITQADISTSGAANDLRIVSQRNTNTSGSPSNLFLESGDTLNGQKGNVYLTSYPGIVDVIATGLMFDKAYPALLSQGDHDVEIATDMFIRAQSIINGAPHFPGGSPGNLWLESGYNPNTNVAGNVYIYSSPGGGISFLGDIISNVIFSADDVTPTISQDTTQVSLATGQPLTIQAQNSNTGIGGDLNLNAGFSVNLSGDGNVNINSNLGKVSFAGSTLQITESAAVPVTAPSGVYLFVNGGVLFSQGLDTILTRLSGGNVIQQPTVAAQSGFPTNGINFTVSNTGGYIQIQDTDANFVNVAWAGVLTGDIIRGNIYFKVNVTSGTILLNIRVYEDAVDVADFTLQIAATALEYVTIPIYWQAQSSPGAFGVQVWASAGVSDSGIITQMFVSNNNWGDFEFIRI
jgi:hypothetical protein